MTVERNVLLKAVVLDAEAAQETDNPIKGEQQYAKPIEFGGS